MHHHYHTNPDRFIGEWRLLPDKSVYEVGAPPLEGLYTISQSKDSPSHLDIGIKWKTADNKDMSYNYQITTDASPIIQRVNEKEYRVVSHIDIDGNILKSVSSTLDGKVHLESSRELIEQANKLEVIILTHHNDGKVTKIYQLYQKVKPHQAN